MKKLITAIVIFIIAILACMSSSAYAAKKDFPTGKDVVAPSITNTYPKNKEKDVMVESTIIIRFDEKIQKGKSIGKIEFTDAAVKSVAFTYEIKDNLLVIIPKEWLKFNTEYKLILPTQTVKDSSGLSLGKQYRLSFTTEKSLYADQSDSGMISEDSDEDAAADTQDSAVNDGTVNLHLEMEAYIADANFNEADKVNATNALKQAGVYVKSITSEIRITENTTKTYDIILEDYAYASGGFDNYLKVISGYDDPYDIRALLLSAPSVIAEGLSRADAELIKYKLRAMGVTVSIVEHVAEPEDDAIDSGDDVSGQNSDTDTSGNKDVLISSISGGMFPVMKILKEELEISLSEAYNCVYNIPETIFDVPAEVAFTLKTRLEREGAVVEIIDHEEEEE